MTAYNGLLFLHIAGLGLFLVGHGYAGITALTRNSALLRSQLLVDRFAMPGLLLVVVTGIALGFMGGWWRAGWLWTAIVILVVVSVGMGFMSVPYHRARKAQIAGDEAGTAVYARARPDVLAWMGSVALFLIIFLMILKPF